MKVQKSVGATLNRDPHREVRSQKFLKKLFTVHSALSGSLFTDKGFTLIEVVLIIVIVAIAIPALLIVLGQGTRQSVDAELQVSATNVAQALMEEIKTKRWDENLPIPPGAYSNFGTDSGETGGTPSTYDDVDDYTTGVPDITVNNITFTRAVQVCYVPNTDLNSTSTCNTTGGSGTDFKRIQVTVSNATIGSVEIVTVVGNYQ